MKKWHLQAFNWRSVSGILRGMTDLLFKAIQTLLVGIAYAQGCPEGQVCVDTGVSTTIPRILAGIVNVLFYLSTAVGLVIFLLGGLYAIASGGNEQLLGNGKRLMRFALIGIAVVGGSWMILSTFINYFLAPLA